MEIKAAYKRLIIKTWLATWMREGYQGVSRRGRQVGGTCSETGPPVSYKIRLIIMVRSSVAEKEPDPEYRNEIASRNYGSGSGSLL
jgi:hypothetical protein